MSTEITTKLQELPHLPKGELLALWQKLFAKPAHQRLRRNLMVPIVANQFRGNLNPPNRDADRNHGQRSYRGIA
jgi:hypothetical protein